MQPCLSLHFVKLKPGHPWIQSADGLVFLMPRLGMGKTSLGPLTQAVGCGDLLVLCGAVDAKILVRSDQEMKFWWFRVSLDQLRPLLTAEELSLFAHVIEMLKRCKVYPASGALAKACHASVGETISSDDLSSRVELLSLAGLLLSSELEQARRNRAGPNGTEEVLARGLEKLSVADITSLSVASLAKRFGCSRRHLNRLFHEHFGYSFCALRMEMRLLKAVSLLRDPGAKILHVAEECGFRHTGLFNGCFKRRFGASPGQFRDGLASLILSSKRTRRSSSVCDLRVKGLCPWAEKAERTNLPTTGKQAPLDLRIIANSCSSRPERPSSPALNGWKPHSHAPLADSPNAVLVQSPRL
jgi:AraC-like DNA-binding protein